MDQTTARRLAAQTGGVATQEARNKGRWGSSTDPWVVVCGDVILREVPGGEDDPCANCGRQLPDHDRNELAACQAEHDEHLGVTR